MNFLLQHPALRVLLAIAAWATAVFSSIASMILLVIVIHALSSERVYEVSPGAVNPGMDGKLVRIHVSEIRAATVDEGGSPAVSPSFGLAEFNALWVRADFRNPKAATGSIKSDTYRIGPYREGISEAHPLYAGAYELQLPDHIMTGLSEERGDIAISPASVRLPDDLKARVVEVTDTHLVMEGNDHTPVHLYFSYQPSPLRADLYMLGRQKGNCIEVQTLIRGQQEYEKHTREHPVVGSDVRWALAFLIFSSCAAAAAYFFTRLCSMRSTGMAFIWAMLIQLCLAALLEQGI